MKAQSGFAARVMEWHRQHGRRDLPWHRPRSPYRVWVSEVMLQQTQVATVIPYFDRFMATWPRLADLAAAELDAVLQLWAGLGYYSRARNLHRAAQEVLVRFGGELPADRAALLALPGIGRSTAGAILAQAFGQRAAILDGNVRRLLVRYHGVREWPGHSAVAERLWALAEGHLPASNLPEYTQGLMDLGALVCRPRSPLCGECPLAEDCVARRDGLQSRLPARRTAPPKPERHVHYALVWNPEGRLLLCQRPPTGVWGGLWVPPEIPDTEPCADWVARTLGTVTGPPRPLPPVRHVFTHFVLHIRADWLELCRPGLVRDDGARRWTVIDRDPPAMPAPIARLLRMKPPVADDKQEEIA